MESDDRQLVLKCQAGQEDAYRELLSRYEGYIFSLCHRFSDNHEDALEMSQEAMLKVVLALPAYHVNRPFKPWLRQVVINACINYLRCRSPDLLSLDQPLDGELSMGQMLADPRSERQVERMETRDALQRALGALPPLYRMVVVMRHQEDMNYQEIAEAAGLPLGTVKSYLFRARSQLRQVMGEAYGWGA